MQALAEARARGGGAARGLGLELGAKPTTLTSSSSWVGGLVRKTAKTVNSKIMLNNDSNHN